MVTFSAPAKLNLFLHVTGKRADGYHLLDSLVVFIDFSDTLTLTPDNQFNLSCSGPYAHLIDLEDNLITHAVTYITSLHPHAGKIHIHLEKNIPVGGGIGGGSANAAATLKALNHFFDLNIPHHTLHKTGLSLGADIPVCLAGTASHMKGIGEKITSVKCPSLSLLLVNPDIHLPTKDIFSILNHSVFHTEHKNLPSIEKYSDLIDFLKNQKNDLFEAASSIHPVLNEVIRIISKQKGCDIARMSGSGATCFGIFKDDQTAQQAHNSIQTLYPHWKSWVTRSI